MGSASLPELGFVPKTPLPGQRRRSVSDAVLAVSLTECFFTTHTPAVNPGVGTGLPHSILAWAQDCPTQSWRGHRIAPLNPGVGTGLRLQSCCGNRIAPPNPAVATGLPHSILAWAQDGPGVSQKTLEAQRCTALRPQTRRPDCAENTVSASVHTDALTDSPPGLRGKHRQCVGTHRCTPGLARLPGFKFGK